MLKRTTGLTRNQPTPGGAGGILFGVVWTAFSSIFLFVGLGIFFSGFQNRYDLEVPCVVKEFEIVSEPDEDKPFRVRLAYEYRVDGRLFTGSRLSPDYDGRKSYVELARMRDEVYRDDEALFCYVDRNDPAEAVLFRRRSSNWFGLIFACFGGGFVLVGIGIVLASIRGHRGGRALSRDSEDSGKMGGVLALGFFGIFAAAGLGVLGGFVVPAAVNYFSAKGWVETPGEVIWSRLRVHRDSDGTTYRADVFYRYTFEGREYRSNSYSLLGTTHSSGRAAKQRVVDAHPAGTPVTCFVNPGDPVEALIERDLGWWALFGLFPLPFLAIGLGGLYFSFFRKKGAKAEAITHPSLRPSTSTHRTGRRGRGGSSTVKKRVLAALAALAFALFWNGIVSVFVWQIWSDWKTGGVAWFMAVFLLPFVLVGLGLIVHFLYRLFGIFSPVYHVEMGPETMEPGERRTVSWRRSGGSGSPARVSVWLIGEEEAEYRRGTSTSVAKEVFYEALLYETTDRLVMPSGRCELVVPDLAVPTFSGKHNHLRWLLLFMVEVPWRPDVRDEYEITVQLSEDFQS